MISFSRFIPIMITIYTDGACRGNPGKGGFGVVMLSGVHRREIAQGYTHTTNNRMELLSVIVALEALKKEGEEVLVYSDSKYVVDTVEKGWVFKWEKTNYKDKKNPDLWKRFVIIYKKHKVKFKWIRGHNENVENERCDVLAVAAAQGRNLLQDSGYETGDY
jgi:ribonuclease HI